jgi:hypothetical protein
MLRRRPVMRTVARTAVIAGTATAVSGRVARRQQNKFAEQQAAQAPAEMAPAPAPAGEDTDDQLAQLEKLGSLHEQGILTDEEFAAKKAQILGI